MTRRTLTLESEVSATIVVDDNIAEMLLRSAINDFLGYGEGKEEYKCSRLWLFEDCSDGDRDPGFVSFYDVCQILRVDLEVVRVAVNICLDKGKRRLRPQELTLLLKGCGKDD